MSKHDTWVFLKTPSPWDSIKHGFPHGFPMRDPFPMVKVTNPAGEPVALWIVDMARLSDAQFDMIAFLLADRNNCEVEEILDQAVSAGGFGIDNEWIEKIEVGPEGWQRGKELAEFLESNPKSNRRAAMHEFHSNQIARWIEGDETPPPLPLSIDEVEPHFRSPELAEAIKQNRIRQMFAQNNYSVMDVLMGNATIDILNELDPSHDYELVDVEDVD